ncbi:MAG: alpha-ketoacid dehydrogenase subunit beta [Anaerolineae bacterium]|nr:alpha-ketoacid dehydrogenase subunit beta [Anaerolineae bacterium]
MLNTQTVTRDLTIVQALREAVREEMRRDDDVFVLGEDIRIGGSFLFTLGLVDDFGEDRVLNTPISEAGFVGLAIGAAIEGMRPIIDFQYGDFLFTAFDQIVQQCSKLRYMSGGQVKIPLVFHLPTGASGRGAQHANSLESFYFHVPGLKIVTPATPYDAKGLFKSAVRDDNPVLFCVHKHLYGSKGRTLVQSSLSVQRVPEEEYLIPLGVAEVKRAGRDVTVVANSLMLHRAVNVADALEQEGVSVEVIDPRTIVPLDIDTIIESVKKTSRLVIVEESNERGGWGAQVAADVAGHAIGYLDAPIRRVAAADVPIPFSPTLENAVVPDEARIRAAILAVARP